MGTSQSYSAPPSWTDIKGQVTRLAKEDTISSFKSKKLISSFIDHNGGSRVLSGRARGRAGGGAIATGGAARNIAGRLASFISAVGTHGLSDSLGRFGWTDLIGKPVQEVLNALLDRLGGDSSTIEDVDARMALSKLQERYFAEADTPERLEEILIQQVDRLEPLLEEFFGFYLHELFCRVFFERLVQRVGEAKAHSFLEVIGDVINSTFTNRTAERDLTNIDWNGPDGTSMITDIMETTLEILGGAE
ncbi:hypothetical protein [Geotalea sp. SG265]|uniref:hypothetical protein n=1 Tax=Geotalea sp. SG265 TaxID=2922867 RepID=UPI001FAFD50A|nr:hypothetical protein [Geotalea sp. SG265]